MKRTSATNLATVQRSAVRFRLKINYLIGGELKSTVIDDDGRPFGITPLNCINRGIASYGVAYEWNEPVKRPVRWQFDLPEVVKNTARYNFRFDAALDVSSRSPSAHAEVVPATITLRDPRGTRPPGSTSPCTCRAPRGRAPGIAQALHSRGGTLRAST